MALSTQKTTRQQFEWSIVAEYSDYSNGIADKLLLTEIKEQELRKFKVLSYCQKAIRDYFKRYDGENPPLDDSNRLNKEQIEDIVRLFNNITDRNFWYEFPDDN